MKKLLFDIWKILLNARNAMKMRLHLVVRSEMLRSTREDDIFVQFATIFFEANPILRSMM